MAKRGAKKRVTPRGKDNLQTVIVPKSVARTRAKAEGIARKYARRIYTSRETKTSWRFRQRPPEDFKKGSFKTFKVPEQDISLVYGTLKASRNPGVKYKRELRIYRDLVDQPARARDVQELAEIARDAHGQLESGVLLDQMDSEIAKHARRLGFRAKGDIYEISKQVRTFGQQELLGNPGKRLPDPGPCAWLGDLVEFKWSDSKGDYIWENGRKKWMLLWSPKMKAIIGIKKPTKMKKQPNVSRKAGAAKISERFKARNAKSTHEIDIPKVQLNRLGKGIHIVYRSDKWNPGYEVDYIHDFKDGVELSCGPTLKNPQVFLCRGGKLTVTERGLVF